VKIARKLNIVKVKDAHGIVIGKKRAETKKFLSPEWVRQTEAIAKRVKRCIAKIRKEKNDKIRKK
jgi:hypothetical protein